MPIWTEKVLANGSESEEIATRALVRGTETREMARLTSGFLIREMMERFLNKIMYSLYPNRSLWLYSVSHTTIAQLLNSLGLFDVI